ncbi:MAG TPA: hypothetical protein VKT82_24640 [Ktedonobacterales bacterium]|nr:hypothetical protein [Ktedonobacterales bacterium]
MEQLLAIWTRLWAKRDQLKDWCGGGVLLLLVFIAFIFRLEQSGDVFAQAPWQLSAWMPTPVQTSEEAPGQPTVPADLPSNVHAFVRLALPYALQAHQALGWQTSVLLAQWGLEHGWQVPDAQGYNWGNTEYAPGCPKPGRFCNAPTPAEGLREYLYTARLPFYDGVRAAVPQGADATAVALGESPWDEGHYTADGHPGDSLLAVMRQFNLYRFDHA